MVKIKVGDEYVFFYDKKEVDGFELNKIYKVVYVRSNSTFEQEIVVKSDILGCKRKFQYKDFIKLFCTVAENRKRKIELL